ncbi:unnamed protein product [Rotaria socialis]|uniref:Uncharacterized protein n=1 Tax=Rotaria socialis TaxID=392032 RepID=A0A820XPE4_9BILA|nr:unnamed protein product [Rotaria socialis]CAF4419289.1 unnamed protein product [Rotaria socialis]CAF4534625.1 unnamed protein product [Rotaria socialis]CAF4657903.1 unnamed protein product [Rotaria socialis]
MTDTTIKSIATVFPFNAEELKRNSTLRRRQSIIREFALNYVNTWYTWYTKCGCVNSLQWTARSAVLPGTNQTVEAPLCNSTDSCYAIAMTEILSTDLLWNQFCSDCSQECPTTDFTITPYSVAAPFTVYFPFIKCFVETSNVTLPTNWSST